MGLPLNQFGSNITSYPAALNTAASSPYIFPSSGIMYGHTSPNGSYYESQPPISQYPPPHSQQFQQQHNPPYGQGNSYGPSSSLAPAYSDPKLIPSSGSGWIEQKTAEGYSFWYNTSTRVSQWDRPL